MTKADIIKIYKRKYPNINIIGAEKQNDTFHLGFAEILDENKNVVELTFNQLILPMRIDYLEHMFGLTPNPNFHYTMNRILDIQDETKMPNLDAAEVFSGRKAEYVMFGHGGVNTSKPDTPRSPNPYEIRPYNILPVRVLSLDKDNALTSSERDNYRLRKIETFGDTKYVCYYARKLNYDKADYKLVKFDSTLNTSSITSNSTDYVIDPRDSDPIDSTTSSNRPSLTGQSIVAYKPLVIETDKSDLKEYFTIQNGNFDAANISECIIATGKDIRVPMENNIQIEYNEVIGCECIIKYTNSPRYINTYDSIFAMRYLISSFGTSRGL